MRPEDRPVCAAIHYLLNNIDGDINSQGAWKDLSTVSSRCPTVSLLKREDPDGLAVQPCQKAINTLLE